MYLLDFGWFLLWTVITMLLWTFVYKFLCEHVIPAVLGAQVGCDCGSVQSNPVFNCEPLPRSFPACRTALHSQQSCARVPFPHVPAHAGYWLFHYNHRNGQEWCRGILICLFLITDNTKRLSWAVGTCVSSLERHLCWALAHFLIQYLPFYHWIVRAVCKFWF